ncbi:hypothetical protein Tco_0044478 [Tanacetum coccineum]
MKSYALFDATSLFNAVVHGVLCWWLVGDLGDGGIHVECGRMLSDRGLRAFVTLAAMAVIPNVSRTPSFVIILVAPAVAGQGYPPQQGYSPQGYPRQQGYPPEGIPLLAILVARNNWNGHTFCSIVDLKSVVNVKAIFDTY